jgi:predicted O-methyltransferase YrrM
MRVWKGGSSMLIALTLLERGVSNRDIVLIDTFEGMTPATTDDLDLHGHAASDLMEGSKGERIAELVTARAGLDDVRAAMLGTGYDPRRIRFVRADVRTDLPNVHTSMICLLRLDTDFYDSTRAELECLYPRVSQGAPVIIDDYGHWQGCRKAVDEYFARQVVPEARPLLWAVDYTGRAFVKPDKPAKADIERYDYVPPGMRDPGLLPLFPDAEVINPWIVRWKYLRPKSPHVFRVDGRNEKGFHIGYASYEEAVCLHNLALPFAGRRGLEIGSYFGWTSAHLRAAGLRMDHVDISFADPRRQVAVSAALDAVPGATAPYRLDPGPSPDCLARLAAEEDEPWSFVFIDGNHDGEAPAADARAVLPYLTKDAVVVFHDLTSPDVAAGLAVMAEAGWSVRLFNTMQVLGVAWRGNVTLPEHRPDPNVPELFQQHLQRFLGREPGSAESEGKT